MLKGLKRTKYLVKRGKFSDSSMYWH